MLPKNWCGPFASPQTYEGKKDFDKYYYEVNYRDVFKESGEVDPDTGDKLGVIESKPCVKKIDIVEYLKSQADGVGVEAYMKALALNGTPIGDFDTVVDDKIIDMSNAPETLADAMLLGDNARKAFANLDPALKGEHTTIEGFLNSLDQNKLDNYIRSRIEALTPAKKEVKENV